MNNTGQTPKSSIDATATATNQVDRLDILEEKTKNIEDSISKSEKRVNQTTTFLMFVAGAVMIAFALAIIPLCFDYYKDNYERYEKYFKGIDELKIRMEILEKRNDLMLENQIKK